MNIIMKSLGPRLLTAVIGIPAVLILIIISELWHPLVGIISGVVSVIMVGEFLYAKKLLNMIPLTVVCMLFALLMPMVVAEGVFAYLLSYLYLLLGFIVSLAYHKRLSFANLAYALFGTMVITFGMSAIPLACIANGYSVSFFFVLIVLLPWMADGGGYFIGGYAGKRKLCPNISPKKTVEGALGGAVFCVAAAMLMGLIFQFIVFSGDNAIRVNFAALVVLAILDWSRRHARPMRQRHFHRAAGGHSGTVYAVLANYGVSHDKKYCHSRLDRLHRHTVAGGCRQAAFKGFGADSGEQYHPTGTAGAQVSARACCGFQ